MRNYPPFLLLMKFSCFFLLFFNAALMERMMHRCLHKETQFQICSRWKKNLRQKILKLVYGKSIKLPEHSKDIKEYKSI